jgi:hypothetical protein
MTTQEIFNEIIIEKDNGNYPELNNLNSTSNVSIWRLWVYIFSFFSKTLRELFDSLKAYIELIFSQNQPGTLQWWIAKIKEFQYGDSLVFVDGVFKYQLIDISKRIIAQVALESINRVLVFKVVKSIDDVLTPLTDDEQIALQSYINRIKFPGTFASILSQLADDIRLNYRIYYNALFEKDNIEVQINETIINYLNNIVFNGKFIITDLTDLLQQIEGINNPVFISGLTKNHYQSESDYESITDYAIAKSGYFKLNLLTLEYIAE